MKPRRDEPLQHSTVKLSIPGQSGWGTGFFVATGLILTCYHVIRDAGEEPVKVRWGNQEDFAEAKIVKSSPDPNDLALLRFDPPADIDLPWVYLDGDVRPHDDLSLFGYPDEEFPSGCPAVFTCEGLTGDPPYIKFTLGQVRPGMSGAPLLNHRTDKVCGMVKFKRDSYILGGGAIPATVILSQFPELVELQGQFRQHDHCLTELITIREDWGDVDRASTFYGRKKELEQLRKWIIVDRCRLVSLLGIGGIGKTSLAVELINQIHNQFDYLFIRSLKNAPSIEKILADLIKFLSNQQQVDLPEDLGEKISLLVKCLEQQRCLLMLDNAEKIMQAGEHSGRYEEGYEAYGELLNRLGKASHKSCLVLTSREKPKEITPMEGERSPVRSVQVIGLQRKDAEKIIKSKVKLKELSGSKEEFGKLVKFYDGHPLALELIPSTIKEIYGGSISAFLEHGAKVFGHIEEILEEQFKRLSDLQKQIMYWLAINREQVSLVELREDILEPVFQTDLQQALASLRGRSLIDQNTGHFTQQPVIMEYITNKLIKQVCNEISTGEIRLFNNYALTKAQTKDYVREMQERLILKPIVEKLKNQKPSFEDRLKMILANLPRELPLEPGYAAGNIINLLRCSESDLTDYDFSRLIICQAYLQGVNLHRVNFSHSDLTKSIFMRTFSSVMTVAFSPTEKLLATGDTDGDIRLWEIEDCKLFSTYRGHTSWVRSVTFSSDGKKLASSSSDQTIRIWDVGAGCCLKELRGHCSRIWSIAFSPNGTTIASASDDRTVRLWDVDTGECRSILENHTGAVWSVVFSPDGTTIASASNDRTVKLWNVKTGLCEATLDGYTSLVWSVAFSPDGRKLASGGGDCKIWLWDVSSRQKISILTSHTKPVRAVDFSLDGKTLASGSEDGTVRLWNVETEQCFETFKAHTSGVWSVAFSSDNLLLASGGDDRVVKLWDIKTNQCFRSLYGHTAGIWSISLSSDDQILVSSNSDRTVRIWDVKTGRLRNTLRGHTNWIWTVVMSPDRMTLATASEDRSVRFWNACTGEYIGKLEAHKTWVWSVAFSPDGKVLASGSDDRTVKLWDVDTRTLSNTLEGHTNWVWSVAFSPDGVKVASGSDDRTVRLWDTQAACPSLILQGHANRIRCLAFSPDGKTLASGSDDHTVKLWDVDTGELLRTLEGHTNWIWSVAFSPDGKTLASGGADLTVKIWNLTSGQCFKTLQNHTKCVRAVTYSSDGLRMISGSEDGTIKFWNPQTGEYLDTLKAEGPYEGMIITGIRGLTEAQKFMLRDLGAVEGE